MRRYSALALPGYAVALWLIVFPLVDLITLALPLSPTIVEWRYSLTELLSRSLMTPVLGVFVAMVLATTFRHRRAASALRVIAAAGAVALLSLLLVFMVDSIGLRGGELRRGLAPLFGGAWLAAVGKVTLALTTLALLARVAGTASESAEVDGARIPTGTERPLPGRS